MSLLKDRWEQAQEGMGQIVMIVADPGLGKSRLVQTIKQHVSVTSGSSPGESRRDAAIIEWRCAPSFQDTGLHPIAEYFKRLLDLAPELSPADQFDRLAQHLDDHGLGKPEVVALFANLLFLPEDERFPAAGLTPAREREETFRVLREWLRARARRQPVLFVVEDLHWIDASSLEFLAQFIGEGLNDQILSVFTFRPVFQPGWPAAAHQTRLALNRLTRRQVAELSHRDAGGALPDALVAQIYERTNGVPLLVEEFSRIARESAIFSQGRDQSIPTTLQQVVLARLDRMSSNREVAQVAAVLGRDFPHDLLAGALGLDDAVLEAELTKLLGAGIINQKSAPPHRTYSFKHALLVDALLGALSEEQRRHFHLRVATTMELSFPIIVERQPELLAQHFTEAGAAERASAYWLQAGRRSHERFANVEAISHLSKGLELVKSLEESDARDARELELLGPLGTSHIAARGYASPEVGPIFDRARSLAGRVGQTPQTFAMMRGNFAFRIVRGEFRLCTDLAEEAMQFAEKAGDPGIMMEALFLHGLTKLYRGDFVGAAQSCVLALAEYDDRERTAFWSTLTGENSGVAHRCYLALAHWHLGSPDHALALNHEARDLARTLNHPFSLEYALHHTGWLHQHCRLGVQCQAAGDEEMEIATEQGFQFWHASGMLYSAAGRLLRGQLDEGLRQFQKGLDAYRASGAGLGLPYYFSVLMEAFRQAGRFEDARRAFDEAITLVEKNDERFQEAELHRLRGELHLAEDNDQTAAESCFRRAVEMARHQHSKSWELRATLSLARLQRRQGRQHEAFTALTSAFDAFDEGFQTPDLVDAAALLKELGNERMREDIAAGIKYVRGCIPPPMDGPVSVDWRYVPSSTLGGDTIGYHWLDKDHLALYLLDVTGHGLDSALLAVTITNVIRTGSLSGADPRTPDQVLASLNRAFQGRQHGRKYFTIWYGVYHAPSRTLSYASGGHPPAVALVPGEDAPRQFPATGPIMGMLPEARFAVEIVALPADTRLYIFSDGVFEVRRDGETRWDLDDAIAYLSAHREERENVMDLLLGHVRNLRGSSQLDDDFSIIEARL
ncbi:hypothetical protein AYO41_02420 [Verrucomicrobia bacterium SCGC AG-212-E04]|nr:hypothetical protein AYO41_02420 [Verrucomicrobia bacterium SCGC AG-212-E04]